MMTGSAKNHEIRADSSDNDNLGNVDLEYSSIMPSLPKAAYESLKKSIKENGLVSPLVISQNRVLVDGHNRLRVCKELHITPKYQIMNFEDKMQEKQFVIEINLTRRHLNEFQKVELGHLLEGIEREKAKIRMSLGGHLVGLASKRDKNIGTDDLEKRVASVDATLQPGEIKGKVSQIIAKKIGVSPSTYERGKKIIEKATEKQKRILRKGATSVTNVYNQIRKEEGKNQLINRVQELAPRMSEHKSDEDTKVADYMKRKNVNEPAAEIELSPKASDDPFVWVPLSTLLALVDLASDL